MYILKIFNLKLSILEYRILGSVLIFSLFLIADLIFSAQSFLTAPKKSTAYGSARWATPKELAPLNRGFLIGKIDGKPVRTTYNVLICAPSRSGKGVSSIIPNLLDHPGSAVILDVKGENYHVTARERHKYGQVFLIDPFHVCTNKSNSFNILDSIDITQKDCVDKAKVLANMICDCEKKTYFENAAETLIQGLILYICHKASHNYEKRNLVSLKEFLNHDVQSFLEIIEDMSNHDELRGYVAATIDAYRLGATKEFSGIINTARTFTAFLNNPGIAGTLRSSDFDFNKIKEETFSVFVTIPPEHIRAYAPYIRAIFAAALNAIKANSLHPKEKVLFVMDEFPQLGYMASFEDNISLVSGYGAQFILYVQDLGQLESNYPNSNTFLSNADRVFFGCNDFKTAKYISDLLGEETILQKRVSETNEKKSVSYVEIGRSLLKPNEVISEKDKAIFFNSKSLPSLLEKIIYYRDKKYKGRFDKNPYV